MNIKPLGDRVLVVPAPAEEKIGGIIIPDTAKEKPSTELSRLLVRVQRMKR